MPSGPSFRWHRIPGSLEPWPQAAYTLRFGGIAFPKLMQPDSTSLHIAGVCIYHGLNDLGGGSFMLRGLEGFPTHLQEKEGQRSGERDVTPSVLMVVLG